MQAGGTYDSEAEQAILKNICQMNGWDNAYGIKEALP
jgi:hypothetical protein